MYVNNVLTFIYKLVLFYIPTSSLDYIFDFFSMLKILGLYLYALLIGHKYCNMLSILNKLTLQKILQIFGTNNVVLDKKVKTQQQQNRTSNIKTLAGSGNWTRDISHPKQVRYLWTTESAESNDYRQCFLNVSMRNVDKQNRICGPHIFNKLIF